MNTMNRYPILKAAVLSAARDIRLTEFNFSQELLGFDLSELTDEELAWCERQVTHGTKFSYDLGLNSFIGERWRRERKAETERVEKEGGVTVREDEEEEELTL